MGEQNRTTPLPAVSRMKRQSAAGRGPAHRGRRTAASRFHSILATCFAVLFGLLTLTTATATAQEPVAEPSHAIVVRTTENVTEGGWAWILESAKAAGVSRIDVLVKQDEDNFTSQRTGRELQSGELLVALPGETTAEGWENSDWLVQMLARAKELEIEIWAWWPVFHDAQVAALYPSAMYNGGDGSVFVDAAVKGVRERQEQLIEKLMGSYDFDGISLDWLRYDNWPDGSSGPLAEEFHARTGRVLIAECMGDPLDRAIWADLRASTIANWVAGLTADWKSRRPDVKWGGYLLPPQFKEVSQNYRYLVEAGLDIVQPMIYWNLWGMPAAWAGEVVGQRLYWLKPGAELMPTLDLTSPESEFLTSFEAMGEGGVAGYLWYLDFAWTQEHFDKITRIQNRRREARAAAGLGPWRVAPALSAENRQADRLAPAEFPRDSSAWTLVMLSELYDQGALNPNDPVIPVLALHRFEDASQAPGDSIWVNDAAYLDRLMTFFAERDFSVIPLSLLRAYMTNGAPEDLPSRPLVLTVDDGAHSVLEYFHPRAQEHGLPYSLSVITSPLEDSNAQLDDHERADRQLVWSEIEQLVASGLVELTSHTHRLHSYSPQDPDGESGAPSVIAQAWLDSEGRQETAAERYRRLLGDLSVSRQELTSRSDRAVTTLAWPYGVFDEVAERAARAAGFTHFLQFGGSRFAKPTGTTHRIARLPITRDDEAIPLEMPEDHLTAQRWWLAFLEFARRTESAPLIEAALVQLDDQRARHPQAELSRAAVDALLSRPQRALRRIDNLRATHPDDPAVERAIAGFFETYGRVL